jgi:hypothetical protein
MDYHAEKSPSIPFARPFSLYSAGLLPYNKAVSELDKHAPSSAAEMVRASRMPCPLCFREEAPGAQDLLRAEGSRYSVLAMISFFPAALRDVPGRGGGGNGPAEG